MILTQSVVNPRNEELFVIMKTQLKKMRRLHLYGLKKKKLSNQCLSSYEVALLYLTNFNIQGLKKINKFLPYIWQ